MSNPENEPIDLFLESLISKNIDLYPAQEEAILELYSNKNVILNTPTGSGKSLVAAALHFLSLHQKKRSIYTCPIKALVNEKFLSLCREFGPDQVGMITGDATVNSEAPIICCTAEILSNLALRLGDQTPFSDIIMDEFHYYSDRDRGMAWQIPLLTLKNSRFLLMSATLGETEFFKDKLTELNQLETVIIKSSQRPVPLEFEYSETALHLKLAKLIEQKKYPIYLVNFTQRECAEDAQTLLSTDFCTKDEKKKILEFIEGVDFKSPYGKEISRLIKHGIGLHHAGLLPRYRVLIEKLAQRGLLKIICGTDTLGVGVNVPIRTVLFTKLCKYDGEKTNLLTVRDFQQISGRAGRKGFDDQGTVVIQAPEHVIENLAMEQKAASDPKKAKKMVKRKPPEKGYIPWNAETLLKLSQGQPEPLTSRFQVNHALVLNMLGREGNTNGKALKKLIKDSHENPIQKKRHLKMAFELFRSLVDRKIIELSPLRVNVDLQQEFSLNHTLSLYLIDTLHLLERESDDYALDLLTLVESIVENPDLILRRQVDRLKTEKMAELKAAGMEYEERIEELEKVEHPKPNRDFIYDTFNAFAAAHPWVNQENIRPKSIAREMFETFQSFHEYIRDYDLERVEGLLLRYLSEVYKVLVQTVPESFRTDSVLSMIEYFRTALLEIDSSLVDEWESFRDPDFARKKAIKDAERENAQLAKELEKQLIENNKRKIKISIQHQVFRVLRCLANRDYLQAATLLQCPAETLEQSMKDYFVDHKHILLDQRARSNHFTKIEQISANQFIVEQTLCDLEKLYDWSIKIEVEFDAESTPRLKLLKAPEAT